MRAIAYCLCVSLVLACAAPTAGTASREAPACVLEAQPELIPVPQPIEGELKYFGLQGAWVTNGLDTSRFSAEDFDRLSAWP